MTVLSSHWKVSVRSLLLTFLILMTFRPFEFLPGMAIVKQVWIVVLFVFTLSIYPLWIARKQWRITTFELYTLFLIIVIPVISAIAARQEFGQPLVYGFLAQRGVMLCAISLVVIFAFRHRLLGLANIENAMLGMAWVTLIVFTLISAVADPTQFQGEQIVGGADGQEVFKFNLYLILFGFYYYFFKGYRFNDGRGYLYSLLFLAFIIIVDGGRAMLISLIITLVYFTIKWGSIFKLIKLLPKLLLAVTMFLVIIYLSNDQYITKLVSKFGEAFAVVTTGEKGEDASSNVRIIETLMALPYVEKHWFMGNGDISNQWHGGYIGVLGDYFFPPDIGFIGVIFMYGMVGTVLFLIQFLFANIFASKIQAGSTPLLNAIKAFLFCFFIQSLINGRFVHLAEISFFMVSILGIISMTNQRDIFLGTKTERGRHGVV